MISTPSDPTSQGLIPYFDFGSVYSPDGREHPVTGQTPVYATQTSAVATPPISGQGQGTPMQNVALGFPDLGGKIKEWLTPDFMKWWKKQHFGARAIALVIAIFLILIAAFRLTKA